MKKSLGVFILSGLLTFTASTVMADHHGDSHHETEPREMEADTNKDGKVSFEEFKAAREKHMQEHFKRRDTNQDGFIDEAERKAAREQWKGHRHGKKDKCEMHK